MSATVSAMTLVGTPAAFAVSGVSDTTNFELEATVPAATGATSDPNAVDDAVTGDDWDNVFSNTDSANAAQFLEDGINGVNEKLFTGGQSKDPQNITSWRWTTGAGVQDKNDIEHAYAARYNATATEPAFLFFGLDRFATAGDATLGFWFLKGQTAPVTVNGVNKFSGTGHQNNDLLVQIDYTNGGSMPEVVVSKWSNGALVTLAHSNTQLCGAASNQTYCAATNQKTESSPWAFSLKGSSGDSDFAPRTFFEGGVNLAEFGLDQECFSTFVAETRSSQSFTSTLSDFVMGNFASCTGTLTTTPSAGETASTSVLPGTSVTDTAVISGSGAANAPYPSSSTTAPGKGNKVNFYLCGPMATGTCSSTSNLISSEDLTPMVAPGSSSAISDAVNTASNPLAPGRYCWHATWAGDENYPAITGESNPTTECFAVRDTTTATSAQNWLPNDSATITASNAATTVAGTISIALYESADCGVAGGDSPVTNQTYTSGPLSGTGSINYSTSNTTYKVTVDKDVSWLVTFTSSDPMVGNSSHCETTSLDITN